ncbi:hypothetical protein GCM10020331_058030 [Ectobacillus funiculus]
MREQLGVHELLELHELLVFKKFMCNKVICYAKKLVTDEQLKKNDAR